MENTTTLVGIVVLVLVIANQLRTRPVREHRAWLGTLVLAAIGASQLVQYAAAHHTPAAAWAVFAGTLVIGCGFGAARGATMRVWRGDGRTLRRGTAVTLGLWLVGLVVHMGLDRLAQARLDGFGALGSVGLVLYLGCVLAVQRLVTARRAQQLAPATGRTA